MKLEDQVCTLEQAKTLDHLGVIPQMAAFWHRFDCGMRWRIDPDGYFNPEEDGVEAYPAFTVAELGVMLPINMSVTKGSKKYACNYWWGALMDLILREKVPSGHYATSAPAEAEARASMLIWLLESGKITAAEVNERLSK